MDILAIGMISPEGRVRRAKQILISLGICGLTLIAGLFWAKNSRLIRKVPARERIRLSEIARRHSKDFYGRPFDESQITGRPTFLIFMDHGRVSDLRLFNDIAIEWSLHGLNIIAISNAPNTAIAPTEKGPDGTWIFLDNSGDLAKAFKVSYKNPGFSLYNEQGEQIAAADNAIGYRGARIYIRKLLGLRHSVREVLVPAGREV